MKQSLTCEFTQAHISLPTGYYSSHNKILDDLKEVSAVWGNMIFETFPTGISTYYTPLGFT